jgi:predicted nucleotidyltransferase
MIMRKAPQTPDEIFDAYLTDWRTSYGHDLEAVALYGSAARGEYVPGKSDLNFLVVVTEPAIHNLRKAVLITEKWRPSRVAVPTVITRRYIQESLDTFPIEFLNLKRHHRTIFGPELLKGLEIPRGHLRLQLERELKSKLLYLRQGLLVAGSAREELRGLLLKTLTPFMELFNALLFLKNEELPNKQREVFARIAQLAELDQSCFADLFRVVESETRPYRDELWHLAERYIAEIEKLTQLVDKM